MIPLILGLGSAALFLLVTTLVYGTQVFAASVWVQVVFWGLIFSGAGVFLLNRHLPSWLCRLQRRVNLIDDICATDTPCNR